MDLIKIKQASQNLMANRKAHLEREKGGIFHHGQRTANLVLTLRNKLLPNDKSHDDILTVAAWFHDCAKGIEPHEQYGSVVAKHALKDLLSEEELDKVCDLISMHCARNPLENEYSDYVKLLQDADMLDHFGVYEVWMNIQYWAHTDGTFFDMINWYKNKHESHKKKHRKLLNYDISTGEKANQAYDNNLHCTYWFSGDYTSCCKPLVTNIARMAARNYISVSKDK